MADSKRLRGIPLTLARPDIALQWHPTRNGDLLPSLIGYGSTLKVWWFDHGHEWIASPNTRTNKNRGCAVCSGHQVMLGVNDFASQCPELAAQWHPDRNGILKPHEVTKGSKRMVWWLDHGHEWKAPVDMRAGRQKQGCAVCAGQQVMVGVNDIATLRADVAAKWHPNKNGDLTPEMFACASNERVWWLDHGHEWAAVIASLTRPRPQGCAVCAGKQVMVGVNDLATVRPDLAAQWHPVLNGALTPRDVTFGAATKVHWTCGRHVWPARVNDRTANGSGCPECAKELGWGTSLAEIHLREHLRSLYPGTLPLDVRVPRSTGTGIWICDIGIDLPGGTRAIVEYDDQNFHAAKEEVDARKAEDLRSLGLIVIRVRVGKLAPLHPHDVHVSRRFGEWHRASGMAGAVAARLTELGYPPAVSMAGVPAA